MEEKVGELWHRFITRISDQSHAEAMVRLRDVQRPLSVYFRALGGDSGLQLEAADATSYQTRRSWLQRIAGSNEKVELAWRDKRSLRLPIQLAWFETPALNRDLYYWLASIAALDEMNDKSWIVHNQCLTQMVLEQYPGLNERYQRLLEAHLAQRPAVQSLGNEEAQAENAIRRALTAPGTVEQLPRLRRQPFPVPLWLHPNPPLARVADKPGESGANQGGDNGQQREIEDMSRRQAERVKEPESDRGLITVRMENIFTWGEFINVDRGSEDEDDLDRAEAVARDIDKVSVGRSDKRAAATLKFDLDLPAEAEDDRVLDDGLLLPEWDWRKQRLQLDHCRIVSMLSDDAPPIALPAHLKKIAKRLRHQFQALAPARTWQSGQTDGQEVDIDAYLRFAADRHAGVDSGGDHLYRDMLSGSRDLSCLLLADLSLSTDTWINNYHRVIDVIRDSMFLFAESLAATGDPFAMYGFSSRKRNPVRIHNIKSFNEPYSAMVRGRIQACKPGYYTRMGAAIRYASSVLSQQPNGRRLLLILTDGKPNDLDQYEGRYGIEDSRHAIIAARQAGLEPFCVTIDKKGNDYLPHLFGTAGYVVIHNPSELPKRLPLLYARLTA